MKTDYAGLLDDAANCIGDMSSADLQILLRRAALMLRNAGSIALNDQVEEAIDSIANFGMTGNGMIRHKNDWRGMLVASA